MKYSTFFRNAAFCLTMLLFSCEKDEIKVSNSEYISGGIGTSPTTGAIEFNFNIPNVYSPVRVRVELPDAYIINEVNGTGNKQIRFQNLTSKTYSYTFEFWGTDGSYNGGGVEGAPLSEYFSINENVEVKNGKTLKISIDID